MAVPEAAENLQGGGLFLCACHAKLAHGVAGSDVDCIWNSERPRSVISFPLNWSQHHPPPLVSAAAALPNVLQPLKVITHLSPKSHLL